MKPSAPHHNSKVRIIYTNILGIECECTGTIQGSPFQDGYLTQDHKWTYFKEGQEDLEDCFWINVAIKSDDSKKERVKKFRVDEIKLIRIEDNDKGYKGKRS